MLRKFLVIIDENEEDVFYVSTVIENTGEEIISEAYDVIAGYLEKTQVSYTYFDIIDVTEVSEVEI